LTYFILYYLVNDPAGNSFIENPNAPANDKNLIITNFARSIQQDEELGLQANNTNTYNDNIDPKSVDNIVKEINSKALNDYDRLGRNEIIKIPEPCPSCNHPGESLTAITDIPHFKEIIIMAFNCSSCGFRNNDIKAGGAVPSYGTTVTLKVESFEDMKRDVLKSDSAQVFIPEIELELQHGTLGGLYTTVEGLLKKILSNLRENNPFLIGDSSRLHHSSNPETSETNRIFLLFLDKLEQLADGNIFPFNLIIRDPLGNSFVSPQIGSSLPPETDPQLHMEDFVRSFEEV